MKPFNLKEALEGKPVVTRNGRKVLQLFHFDKADVDFKLCAHIEGNKQIFTFNENGSWTEYETSNDLFMATEKKKLYLAVYNQQMKDGNQRHVTSSAYESLDILKDMFKCTDNSYQIIEIEIEV